MTAALALYAFALAVVFALSIVACLPRLFGRGVRRLVQCFTTK